MPSSRCRIEEEEREAVGARLGVDGAEGEPNRAPPQRGADGTPAVQGYPLLPPWLLGPVGTTRRGQGAQPGLLLQSGRKMKTLFFSLVIKESLSTERKSTNDASSGII